MAFRFTDCQSESYNFVVEELKNSYKINPPNECQDGALYSPETLFVCPDGASRPATQRVAYQFLMAIKGCDKLIFFRIQTFC